MTDLLPPLRARKSVFFLTGKLITLDERALSKL